MIVMHSLFDLDESCTESEFQFNIDELGKHLTNKNLLISSRLMRQQAHPGYNAEAPSTSYYLAMEFIDMQQAEKCWSYIEGDTEPVSSLHNLIKKNVCNSSFFLYRDIKKG